jgi:hypothetical protein
MIKDKSSPREMRSNFACKIISRGKKKKVTELLRLIYMPFNLNNQNRGLTYQNLFFVLQFAQ